MLVTGPSKRAALIRSWLGAWSQTLHDPALKKKPPRNPVPTGVLVSTQDVTIRRWAERENNIVHWTELTHGGHFALGNTAHCRGAPGQ